MQLVHRRIKITKKILWQAFVSCNGEGPIHPQTHGEEKIQNCYLSSKHSQLYTQINQHYALILELSSKLKSIAYYSRNWQISVFLFPVNWEFPIFWFTPTGSDEQVIFFSKSPRIDQISQVWGKDQQNPCKKTCMRGKSYPNHREQNISELQRREMLFLFPRHYLKRY